MMKEPLPAKLRKTVDLAEVAVTVRRTVLSGAFASTDCSEWKTPPFKLIPFISSTFTDTGAERDYLQDLLYEMRAEANKHDIQVILVDMRWGVRDENTSEHLTWIACSRALEWCKNESSGLFFFSLQADKYGYTPLPKFLRQDVLDERLQSLTSSGTADPSTIAAIRQWYSLDTNAVPPQYVLRNLTEASSKEYWDNLPKMVDALREISFDEKAFPGLLKVGHSVTEWEVLTAFQKQLPPRHQLTDSYSAEVPTIDRDLETSFLWSRRRLASPLTAEEDPKKFFDDGRDNEKVATQLSALKESMEVLFPPSCVTDHVDQAAGSASELTLSGYQSLDKVDGAAASALKYLRSFEQFAKDRLMGSLQRVITLKQRWAEDGCGMRVPGSNLAEMLHHCQWAQAKCATFQGRGELVSSALKMLQKAERHGLGRHSLSGISMCVVGVSGAGKTALMAKLADCIFQANRDVEPAVPVIVRFCGTSAGSRNARSLICSIAEQLELLLGLEHKAAELLQTSSYDEQVSYFGQLLQDHPVVLFIDSLDQLTDEDQGRSRISFLRDIIPHPQSRIIVSCLPDEYDAATQEWKYCYLCETRLREAGTPRVDVLVSADVSEPVQLMQSMLLQQCGRTLTAAQWEVVNRSIAVEPTALYLNLAVRVVQQWTSEENNQQQLPGGVRPLIEHIFTALERDFGKDLTRAALGFITYFVNGVSDVEMEDLLSMHDVVLDNVFQYATPKIRRLPSHVWLRLKQALVGLVVEREQGCTTWYHRQLKETAEPFYAPEKQQLLVIIAKYFGNLIEESVLLSRKLSKQEWTICGRGPFHAASVVNKRRCAEGTAHMMAAGMVWEAAAQLCSFECVCSMIRAGQAFRLVEQLIDLTRSIPDSVRARHFLRWLRQDVYFLSSNPIKKLLTSALDQPKVSSVRALGAGLLGSLRTLPGDHSIQIVTQLIGPDDFSALVFTLEGHRDYVECVAYSPDGKHFASSSTDKTVRLWDALTGAHLSTLEGHDEGVSCVAYSPNSKRIVTGSLDDSVRMWDVATCAHLFTLEGHTGAVASVAYSPDGKRIVSGSLDKTLRVWDAATGSSLFTLEGHSDRVTSVIYSSDGLRIVSGSRDNTIRVWKAINGAHLIALTGHSYFVYCLAGSPDGKFIVSGSWDDTVRVWDALNGAQVGMLKGHSSWVNSVAYSPDGKHIVSGSEDKTVRVWDVFTRVNLFTLVGHRDFVTTVVYSSDGKHIVSGSRDQTVRVWDAQTDSTPSTAEEGHEVMAVIHSPDGRHIVSASDGAVRVWDAANCAYISTLFRHIGITRMAYSPDGKHIVTGDNFGSVRVWDANTGAELNTLNGHYGAVLAVAYSPDGKHIVSSSNHGMWVWDAATCANTLKLTGHRCAFGSVAYSPDGRHIVSGSLDEIAVWDSGTGKRLFSTYEYEEAIGESGYVWSVAYSPDGKRIVSGSQNRKVRVWDAATGNVLSILEGHQSDVSAVAYSPDGKFIVSGSSDTTVRVWDALTGAQVVMLEGHRGWVNSVAYSPDGKHIVSGSQDKTVRVWDVAAICL